MDRDEHALRPVALITGASSGIGAAFARKLAQRGYDLLLVARREDRLAALAAELRAASGAAAEVLPADLVEDTELKQVEERLAGEPRLELLVNNAGFGTLGLFHQTDRDGQDRMHRLHVTATMRLARAALPGMVARRKGAIVNVSSVAAFGQSPQNVSYCATKCWMNSFTEGLAIELASIGSPVRVQALCPGYTLSEFHDVARMDRKRIPAGLWMRDDFVVEESLRGLERGKLYVVPGWKYRLAVLLLRALPRFVRMPMAIRFSRRYRKPLD